jgi:flagella synthesis protein FlgN
MTMIEKTYPLIENHILNTLPVVEQLYQQLKQEADALKQMRQAEKVDRIANHKKQLVVQMEQLSKHLGELLAVEQLPNNQEGIEAYFQHAEALGLSTAEASGNWARIRSLSANCRTLNEQNGACIELLSRHTKRSLQILNGKSQFANTYGPDGATKSDYFNHTLLSV